MKKYSFLVFFAFIALILLNHIPSFGQGNKSYPEIENTLNSFIKEITASKIDSAMDFVSPNYANQDDAQGRDYVSFKALLSSLNERRSKNFKKVKVNGITILEADVDNDTAIIAFKYSWKGINQKTLKEDSGEIKRVASLENEAGSWKITKWGTLYK
jgi:hypothetical protein